MKAVFEKKEGNKVSFSFEIGSDEFKKAEQQAYLKNRGRFNIPGFRKGKVPKKIIELNYGEGIFYEDAINLLLPEAYGKAIEELELEPVDTPEVDIEEIEKDSPIVVKIKVDVKPEVKLGDYKSIELEKIEYNVTDEMIESELKSLQDANARLIDGNDRQVKQGDLLTIDFEGYVDGEQFPGGTAEGHKLEIGSNTFIPGFEEQLVGKSKDEEVEVNVKFPEEYHEESLAGKDAMFKVTIHDIKEKELPELDDELAKDISEFDTLEELKNDIKERLEKELKTQETIEKENRVIEKVIEISEVDIPEGMIESQIDDEIKQFDYRLRTQGLEFETYLELMGSDIDAIRDQFRPAATQRVNADLVLEAISKAENIEVTDEDIDEELGKLAEQYNAEDKDGFISDMKKGDLGFLKAGIANSKVIELLIENTKFN
ncbi:trigger factor [Wansuia hejianensis]|uniref:Trigger factor n=1 Tax=Wansuia hejianensis TaxID=2763667 RepID=A0A926IMS8_9FIRM|nr:trigger factor [Wansuia hejianensis]MBC8591509.1 trigger factor [Wansuia hejianensis]